MPTSRIRKAADLMAGFLQRTSRTGQRYLWTDAFAVCNLLGLARLTGQPEHTRAALQLVADVHGALGRQRPGRPDSPWLGHRDDAAAAAHPTAAGLRIGKPLDQRQPGEPSDPQREWDQDGQYFHYLTRWMHALDQASRATGQAHYARWGIELADVAHRAFTYAAPEGGKRMYWKMSIDLSRPLVPSMGQHDPLDGLVMALELEATRRTLAATGEQALGPSLIPAAADFATMLGPRGLTTADALGLGGLMADAARLHRLVQTDALPDDHTLRPLATQLLDWLLVAAAGGLRRYLNEPDHRGPPEQRLGFRELGLAIGLSAVEQLQAQAHRGRFQGQEAARVALQTLTGEVGTRETIASFWLAPAHQRARSWQEHLDINEVMLATALAPDGFLGVPAGASAA
jgi:hypothetical protein